jgi:ribosome-associated toxin RatA of RatAB toxin-antitoxin module
MTKFSVTTEIAAAPNLVWVIVRDVERWPEWTPTVTSVQRLDTKLLTVGARIKIKQPKLPTAIWQVTEFDDAKRSFTWTTQSPGIKVIARHWVEEVGLAGQDTCRVTLSIEFRGIFGPLMARVTRSLNEQYLQLEAAGLTEAATNKRDG